MPFIDKVQVDGVFYDIQSKDTQSFNNLPPSDYALKKDLSKYVLRDDLFPVGSIYMNINDVNPSTLFGGTWEQIQGRFLLSASSEYQAGSTGGEKTHTLTINEMPSHNHAVYFGWGAGSKGSAWARTDTNNPSQPWTSTFSTGGSQAHNNMPPYLAVYMWKRTA